MRLSDHVELNGPTPKASITSVENVTKYHQFSVKYRLLEGNDMTRRANSHCYNFFEICRCSIDLLMILQYFTEIYDIS